MKQYLLSTLAVTVGLSFAGAARVAAETVVAQAVGDPQPGVVAFYDSADGKTSGIDDSMSQNVAAALAGAQYLLTDAGHLLVLPAQANPSSAQPVLPIAHAVDASGNQGTYYLAHTRTSGNFVDGAVARDPQHPAANYVILDLVFFDQQGNSESIHIEQNLTWTASPGPATQPGGGLNPGVSNPAGSNPVGGSNPLGGGSEPMGGGNPTDGGSTPLGGGPSGGTGPSVF